MNLKQLHKKENLLLSVIILAVVTALILILLPEEETLGSIIKLVFLHAAQVQSALLAFAVAGVIGLLDVILKKESLYQWGFATQKTAVLMWILYYSASMVVTYLSWGIAIAWNEPRVQMTIRIMALAVIALVITIWINKRIFTAVINTFLATIVLYFSLTVINIRHPENPIGESGSILYPIAYFAVLILTILFALQVTRWFKHRQ